MRSNRSTTNPSDLTGNRAFRRSRKGRVAAASAVAAGLAIAAVPAGAAAAGPTCKLDTNTHTVTLDATQGGPLRIVQEGASLNFDTGMGFTLPCGRDAFTFADNRNTDTIVIKGNKSVAEDITIDNYNLFGSGPTPDPDGHDEMKFIIDSGAGDTVSLNSVSGIGQIGTPVGPEAGPMIGIRTGSPSFGDLTFLGSDSSIDVKILGKPRKITMVGTVSDNGFTGRGGFPNLMGQSVPLELRGEGGHDRLEDGNALRDVLVGGPGRDHLYSNDNIGPDLIDGGPDLDEAVVDQIDSVGDVENLKRKPAPVGVLKLAKPTTLAQPGKPATVKLSWASPTAWKDIKSLKVKLISGGSDQAAPKTVGSVLLQPAKGKATADGSVDLKSSGVKLGHHGKTVSAELPLVLAKELAGQTLGVKVEATSAKGKTQVEDNAGYIQVAG